MNLYRITKTQYANDLAGTGGLLGAGRWHREGTRIVYMSGTVSLAMLEVLGHWARTPVGLSLLTIQIPNIASVYLIDAAQLPAGWREEMHPESLSTITTDWIQEGNYWIMRVPSVHSPTEYNYLLNPLHPEHQTLKIVGIEPHPFDPRLKTGS